MKAKIIALEGIDQSGKHTQAQRLARKLRELNYNTALLSFPIYESSAGRRIRGFLRGKETYSPSTLHMLYSLNRWENLERIKTLASEKDFLIADRYTPSNLAYGLSRRLDLTWLAGLDKGLPRPDLVIVLDTSVPSSFARKSKRRDAHETNRRFLAKVRRNYKILARRLSWSIVDASAPVGQVESAVWKTVRKKFRLPRKDLRKPTQT